MATDSNDDRYRRWLLIALAIISMMVLAGLFWGLWVSRYDCVATDFVLSNWKVVLGLPFMSLASFIIVALFRQPSDPIEFAGLGFSVKGSAGEVVLWCLCFLSMAGAVKLLASPDYHYAGCSRVIEDDRAEPIPDLFSNQVSQPQAE
ncbi:hypothetical protein SAMN05192583_0574 [Sphingomonas gellani]|uniref:Uncharacterized protein n=1 Tax=Sphingomonas gellani TaxID=1166340 RepID=A0A1H7Z7A6_9SPHN|nr:hypothetical protein [Sphingomonas gellani]SEM54482.1 hypothetical protein SAMN05192583_0574 [Sphingomonas gellani]